MHYDKTEVSEDLEGKIVKDGEYWAYERVIISPVRKESWILTERDMSNHSTATHTYNGSESYIASAWKVRVKNNKIKRI